MSLAPTDCSRLVDLHNACAERLVRVMTRRFPSFCPGRIEDAVASAFADVLARKELLEGLARASDDEAYRLLYQITWRQIRGQWRRRSYRAETDMEGCGAELLTSEAHLSSPEAALSATELSEIVVELVRDAAESVSDRHRERLFLALLDRFYGGLSDTEAADRHEVPREYVNRGKSLVRRALDVKYAERGLQRQVMARPARSRRASQACAPA